MSSYIAVLQCDDQPGIIHAMSGAVMGVAGNILENDQFTDPGSGQFCMRTRFESLQSLEEVDSSMRGDLEIFNATLHLRDESRPRRAIILVSKYDHCITELLYRISHGDVALDVVAVVANHPDLAPLAQRHGVDFHFVDVAATSPGELENLVRGLIDEFQVDYVILARYMQILSSNFCADYAGRIVNIHHSFLPGFKGAKPYHQAYERGVKLIGATAHYVTPDLDEGPIIEQDVVRVTHARSVDDLVTLGRDVERYVLARAVRLLSEDRVLLVGLRTIIFQQ